MSQVFLDTVGLLAVWDRRDQWHDVAKPVWLTEAFTNDRHFQAAGFTTLF
jgi:predicted nucleic acid-binding protein